MTRWVWEGNKPLHEWQELVLDGRNTDDVITWLFEEDSFAPIGKLQGTTRQSILTDHLGTPLEMVEQGGQRTWQAQTTPTGASGSARAPAPSVLSASRASTKTARRASILYYNRFRYYDPQEGMYVSQDPIGLAGNNPTFYSYASEPNKQIDPFGLSSCLPEGKKIDRTVYRYSPPDRIATTWDAHKWNVAANHRYTKPGVGGVYGANSAKTAAAEVAHYGIDQSTVQLVSRKVKLKNVLDLTDSKVRKKMGVELSELTGDSYTKTHELGDWAVKNGYNGLLAPSARNKTGSNLISFADF